MTDKLATGDIALLHAAQTGEGLIELTPDVLDDIKRALDARKDEIATEYPALVASCDYKTRLAVTAWVIENIVKHATEGGSFRYLIYERLGFDMDAYVPLYMAGGMTISNEFDLSPPEDRDADSASDSREDT